MRSHGGTKQCFLLLTLLFLACLCACGPTTGTVGARQTNPSADDSRYLASVIDEPDTTDFQCTTIHYTIALNVFDRLVETRATQRGGIGIVPSLAESWEVSDDGRVYRFRLRDDVTFSNGSELTASDVQYTFRRMLTNPNACNQDVVSEIAGADELMSGEATDLKGFRVLGDHEFEITLQQPYAAFLAQLCMPGASILDEQSTEAAGDQFGKDPASTIGTGPFVFEEWVAGDYLKLAANPNCWQGAPRCEGVLLRFVYEPDELNKLYHDGKLDILNIDDLGDLGEYYLNGNAYRDQVHTAPHIGIDYIALNASVAPLDDARVRKALQLALNRQTILDAVYSGSGRVENGIFPHGLYGFNPDLPTIPHDPEEARRLLDEAGLADGFELNVCMRSTTPQWQRQLVDIASSMWQEIGVRTNVKILSEDDFMEQRTTGKLPCYTASWAADFDDPDNFIYTFFGTPENTKYRSLCYGDQEVMSRVRNARSIIDEAARIKEYNELERVIVQEDAAWIPLFSRDRNFLVSNRVVNFNTTWNGWFETSFSTMSIREP